MSQLSAPVSVTNPAWPRLPEPHSRRGHGSLCLLPMPCEVRGEWPPGSQTGRTGTVFPRVGQVFVRGTCQAQATRLSAVSGSGVTTTRSVGELHLWLEISSEAPRKTEARFPALTLPWPAPCRAVPGRHERGSPRPAGSIGYRRGTAAAQPRSHRAWTCFDCRAVTPRPEDRLYISRRVLVVLSMSPVSPWSWCQFNANRGPPLAVQWRRHFIRCKQLTAK